MVSSTETSGVGVGWVAWWWYECSVMKKSHKNPVMIITIWGDQIFWQIADDSDLYYQPVRTDQVTPVS